MIGTSLKQGDILLYGDNSIVSRLIKFRTWSDVSHVEVYAGDGKSLASRSNGPRIYPLRQDSLIYVIRPATALNWEVGMKWFVEDASKRPYGYLDLFRFYGLNIPTKGLICSEFADLFFQHCGVCFFNPKYPEGAVCPRDYLLIPPSEVAQFWSAHGPE